MIFGLGNTRDQIDMIQVIDPVGTFLFFLTCTFLAFVFLRYPYKLTRWMGKFYFRFKASVRAGRDYKPAILERVGQGIAQKAIDDPKSVPYYRVLWLFLGLQMLLFSLCSLLALVTYLLQSLKR